MTETGVRATAQFRVANASVFMGTIAGIVVLIGLLLTFDVFLAHLDHRASAARADTEYQSGLAALRAGRPSDAADHFGTAVSIDRSNVNYALALGEAMLQEGRTTDAEATLRALLARAENDGAVNLTMAHVMLREARTEDAKAYLHRAIFGRWGADSVERRNQARFELIDLLAARGAPRELLAELLPFEDVSPDSVALRRRLGKLFILAGSPVRAAAMFRDVLKRDPTDAEAYAGLGETAIAAGNLRTARADLTEAARLASRRCGNTAPSPVGGHGACARPYRAGYRGEQAAIAESRRCSRGRSAWCRRAPVAPRRRWTRRERCCHRRRYGVPTAAARIPRPMLIV